MKRLLDLILAFVLTVIGAVPMLLIAAAIKLTSSGPVLHWSDRVGKHGALFKMPKFRTMRVGTPQLATHLLTDSHMWMTPIGRWLRKTSLDELPQLWSIVTADLSFVGPRPALFNQHDLIARREAAGVNRLTPGLTGWAQINGRDKLRLSEKMQCDIYYLQNHSLLLDLEILLSTVPRVALGRNIQQQDQGGTAQRGANVPIRSADQQSCLR